MNNIANLFFYLTECTLISITKTNWLIQIMEKITLYSEDPDIDICSVWITKR
jgi:hypothetical protein